MNIKKLAINSILLAIGAILHQITPALGLPMQPDFSLMMLFIIMMLNRGDYKVSMLSAIITGVFTALTTKFPGGQLPNIIDKVVTANVVYLLMFTLNKIRILNNLKEARRNNVISGIVFVVGTFVSGTVFLLSAQLIVGLPAAFIVLLISIVIPAMIINSVAGIFVYNIVKISMRRSVVQKQI